MSDYWVALYDNIDFQDIQSSKCSGLVKSQATISISPLSDKDTLYCVLWEGSTCDTSSQSNIVGHLVCKVASPPSSKTVNSLIPVITGLFFLTIALLGLVMLRRYWLRKQRKALEDISEAEDDEGELVTYDAVPQHIQTNPIPGMGYPMATYPVQSVYAQPYGQAYPGGVGGVQLFPMHPMMQTNIQTDPLASVTPVYTSTRPGFGMM